MRLIFLTAAIGMLVAVCASPAWAQAPRDPAATLAQGTSYFVFAQPGEATVEVIVLGGVASGIYVLGTGTDISELLALAGGGGRQAGAGTSVTTTIRLLRQQGGERLEVYEAELNDMLRSPSSYPTLQDGDIFSVETVEKRRFDFQNALSIVTTVASLAILILQLTRAN